MARTKAFNEQEVLEKARDLFWKQGYTATSIGDLEKHLGISRSSLYQTFGGKRALYDRTLATYRQDSLGSLRKSFSSGSIRTTLTRLFIDTANQQYSDCASRARGCYMVNATTEMANNCGEALSFVAANRVQFTAVMQDALARAKASGELDRAADTQDWANYLFVCYNGLQVVVQTGIDRGALTRALTNAVEALPWKS